MKLRNLTASMLGTLGLWVHTLPAQAEPAIHFNGEIRIHSGIVHLRGNDQYYKNIIMFAGPDGAIRLIYGKKRRLALLDELELNVVYGAGVDVELTIGGSISNGCVELERTAISRDGDVFHVLVAETPPDPWVYCTQALQPFSITVNLDAGDLQPGEYTVMVNNEPMAFTVEDLGA